MTHSPHRFELVLGERGYPDQLAQSPNPPTRLFGIGYPEALAPGVAMVGARKATPYGLRCADMFASWAAGSGYRVISGAAIGCDQAVHHAALNAGGTTVAVLPGGADVAYPRASGTLLREIVRAGAVVSEHPWGTEPKKWTFSTRNRIIAGLARALLVLEANKPSGTFGTVGHALAAGREVWAVPGSIFAPENKGPNSLILEGAQPVVDCESLRSLLEDCLGPPSHECPYGALLGEADGSDPIIAAVRADPTHPEDLAAQLGLDARTLARRLGALEAQGTIVRFRDGRIGCTR